MKWEYLHKPRGGHKFFRGENGRIAIADDSGSNPERTDEYCFNGVLYLDFDRPVVCNFTDGGFSIPLITEYGKKCSTYASLNEAVYVIRKLGMKKPEMPWDVAEDFKNEKVA